ncbi:MAG: peptide-methionine (S)-S-oxide reductase, partial [Chthoniobacterales bacterium]
MKTRPFCRILLLFLAAIGPAARAESSTPAKAVFAGGCFWCMQPPFDQSAGVISTLVGYTGGSEETPTYQQ